MPTHVAPLALLDLLGITEPSELDIDAIAQHVGATVLYAPLANCEGRLLGHSDRAFITVRANAPRARQRFTAAHELGHWMTDRERVARACDAPALRNGWRADDPERRANRYAADLLLPRPMFAPISKGKAITFESVRELVRLFDASLTATAIRLVELGSFPAMIVCSSGSGRMWFIRGPDVPDDLWPREHPLRYTAAATILSNGAAADGAQEICSEGWIDHPDAARYALVEDSVKVGADSVLSLLWWKDEGQLLDLGADADFEG